MARKPYAFGAHAFTRNLFTKKNLEDYIGRGALNRAMKVTRIRPSRSGYFTEKQARALIVAHRGDLYELIFVNRRM
jgi:hypothetical protein